MDWTRDLQLEKERDLMCVWYQLGLHRTPPKHGRKPGDGNKRKINNLSPELLQFRTGCALSGKSVSFPSRQLTQPHRADDQEPIFAILNRDAIAFVRSCRFWLFRQERFVNVPSS
jgi:hypothetical protein